jgi:hypothetical protein
LFRAPALSRACKTPHVEGAEVVLLASLISRGRAQKKTLFLNRFVKTKSNSFAVYIGNYNVDATYSVGGSSGYTNPLTTTVHAREHAQQFLVRPRWLATAWKTSACGLETIGTTSIQL